MAIILTEILSLQRSAFNAMMRSLTFAFNAFRHKRRTYKNLSFEKTQANDNSCRSVVFIVQFLRRKDIIKFAHFGYQIYHVVKRNH